MRAIGLILIALFAPMPSAFAAAPWEVAVLFLGASENEEFQRDIDQNILELARTSPGEFLRLGVYRELPDRIIEYFPDPRSSKIHSWDPIFFEPPGKGLKIPGDLLVKSRSKNYATIWSDPNQLSAFFSKTFRRSSARRILLIYGHGHAFNGFGSTSLSELKTSLEMSLPRRGQKPLDALWFDSCFMGNLEVAYELRRLSHYFVASQDAEFSAGLPFEGFQELSSGPANALNAISVLAEHFVESYSYVKKGSQRRAAMTSSATLAVIATHSLDKLVDDLADWSKSVSRIPNDQKRALGKMLVKARMERDDLVDLGSLLRAFARDQRSAPEARTKARRILEHLELVSYTGRSPKILVRPPSREALLVFGYEGWSRAHEQDAEGLAKLPGVLQPREFVPGPREKRWPALSLERARLISPFSVGLNEFQFYFASPMDGRPLTGVETVIRTHDYVTAQATREANPIQFYGYTQGVANAADRYTGVSVLDPTQGAASVEYLDTEFAEKTGWGKL